MPSSEDMWDDRQIARENAERVEKIRAAFTGERHVFKGGKIWLARLETCVLCGLMESNPLHVPAPEKCPTCGGSGKVIDPESIRRCLDYGDPMEEVDCPACMGGKQ